MTLSEKVFCINLQKDDSWIELNSFWNYFKRNYKKLHKLPEMRCYDIVLL